MKELKPSIKDCYIDMAERIQKMVKVANENPNIQMHVWYTEATPVNTDEGENPFVVIEGDYKMFFEVIFENGEYDKISLSNNDESMDLFIETVIDMKVRPREHNVTLYGMSPKHFEAVFIFHNEDSFSEIMKIFQEDKNEKS